MKKLILLLSLFLATTAHASKVEVGLTYNLIFNNETIWNLVKGDIKQPLEVSGRAGRNASHATWQSVLDNALYVNNAMLFTPVLPWATISGSRVPADWPGAWKYDEEGNQTERKRWWEYTRVFWSADGTEGIMQMNGPMSGVVIVDGKFSKGNFLTYYEDGEWVKNGGCTDDLLKKYIALSGGFLTWNEGLAYIQAWGIIPE